MLPNRPLLSTIAAEVAACPREERVTQPSVQCCDFEMAATIEMEVQRQLEHLLDMLIMIAM